MINGLPDGQWLQAKAQARNILIARAKAGKNIHYGELAALITEADFEARDPRFFRMLEDLSKDEHNCGRGLISAIVVQKGEEKPGKGYFILAKSLGRDVKDETTSWATEVMRVYADWH